MEKKEGDDETSTVARRPPLLCLNKSDGGRRWLIEGDDGTSLTEATMEQAPSTVMVAELVTEAEAGLEAATGRIIRSEAMF
ncbi:hypothetical protein E3N88_45067 [Mikania micrantha]|uniref:Uncharacterized protein n=1 Tax=Mikania micrantha TaxID=192012 RepID=A0A5N6LA93_9ASTR|nr:hypothetical protein E3N88_45067 [Mikania micrantha]